MASGIIFFSPVAPPSVKGFLSGTVGCASLSAAVFTLCTGIAGISPAAAHGAAAGTLLMWYKATNCIVTTTPAGLSNSAFIMRAASSSSPLHLLSS